LGRFTGGVGYPSFAVGSELGELLNVSAWARPAVSTTTT
jgi:hypothetical protein